MIIYVVRHGVTEWNKYRKIQGSANIPLAEEGILFAIQTGKALKEVSFDRCYTSPLIRARQTAEYILGNREIPIIEEKRIQEINFGKLEGTVFVKGRDEEANPQMAAFFENPSKFGKPENGESLEDIIERTRDFWKELVSDENLQDKTILVSTHGCATRALLQNVYQEKDLDHFWHGCVPPNCAVNIIEVDQQGARLIGEDIVYY